MKTLDAIKRKVAIEEIDLTKLDKNSLAKLTLGCLKEMKNRTGAGYRKLARHAKRYEKDLDKDRIEEGVKLNYEGNQDESAD